MQEESSHLDSHHVGKQHHRKACQGTWILVHQPGSKDPSHHQERIAPQRAPEVAFHWHEQRQRPGSVHSDSDSWQMKMKDKLVLLGKHGARIAVGGREDDHDDNIDGSEDGEDEGEDGGAKGAKARDKNDLEPFLFHSPPSALCADLIQAVDPIAVVGWAADGKMAELCLEHRIPFWGLGFTVEHCQALTSRLEGRVFEKMQSDQSKLFALSLKVILDKNCPEEEQVQAENKKKTTKRKNKGGAKGGSKGSDGKAEVGEEAQIQDGDEAAGQADENGGEGQPEKKAPKPKAKPGAEKADMLSELQKLATSVVE